MKTRIGVTTIAGEAARVLLAIALIAIAALA